MNLDRRSPVAGNPEPVDVGRAAVGQGSGAPGENELTATVLASWRQDWIEKGSPWHYCADHWMVLHGVVEACTCCGAVLTTPAESR